MTRIRNYETMFIVKSNILDEDIKAQIQLVKNNIEVNGGEILAYEDMGSRELAYNIGKNKRGYYYVFYFTAPTQSILELERNFNINENIIRHMFVKYESKKDISFWTQMKDKALKKIESKVATETKEEVPIKEA